VIEGTTTENYVSNNLNQYSSVEGTSLTYDLNGNLLTDGTNTYEYDYENQLVKVTTSTNIIRYSFDAFGRRIAKDVYDSGNVFIEGEKYLYSGDEVLCEYDSNDILLRKFVLSNSIDEPILMENAVSGERYYYSRDGLGSVTEVSDSTGSVVEKYSFDVYGKPVVKNGTDTVIPESAIGNPYLFTNRRYDQETGLYHYRARAYSPQSGRFLQIDPEWYSDGLNLYTYVENNPTTFVDPRGNFAITATAITIGIPVVVVIGVAWIVIVRDWQQVNRVLQDTSNYIRYKTLELYSRFKPTPSGEWPPAPRDLGIEEPGVPGGPPKIPFKKIPKWLWPLPFIQPLKDILDPLLDKPRPEPERIDPKKQKNTEPYPAPYWWNRV
jgi:RHS repeat-associated protein